MRPLLKRALNLTLTLLVVHVSLESRSALAQDYPYDDESTEGTNTAPKARANTSDIPRESPDLLDAGGKPKPLPALFRIGVKAGAEYTTFQSLDSITGLSTAIRSPGFSGLISLGWDLPYQPIFIELETGYRGLLINHIDRLHIIPLQAGIYKRVRSGPHNLIKFGIAPSLDMRIARQTNDTTGFSIVPSVAFNVIFEWGGFLMQPGFTLYRIHSGDNFVSFGALAGYRF